MATEHCRSFWWGGATSLGGALIGAAMAFLIWHLQARAERREIQSVLCADIPRELRLLSELRVDTAPLIAAMKEGPNAQLQSAYHQVFGYRAARLGSGENLADRLAARLGSLNSISLAAVHAFYSDAKEARWRFDGALELVDGRPNKKLEQEAARRFEAILVAAVTSADRAKESLGCSK